MVYVCARTQLCVCVVSCVVIRVCAIVREGNVISCIEQEAIRNYERYGPPLLPGVYYLADAECRMRVSVQR